MSTGPFKLSIIIPVRNEGVNLKMMLKILKATIDIPHELLIVYDRADDDSLPVVRAVQDQYAGLRAVQNTTGPGVPNALRAGMSQAGGDYIMILTADDLGPVLSVEKMYAKIEEGYDIVGGTRYSQGGRYLGGAFMSRTLSRIANQLFTWISRTDCTDHTLGIKMLRKSILNQITLEAKTGWAIAFELAIKGQLAGLKMTEVPLISINRFYGGKSSFKLGGWVWEYSRWFVWGIKELYQQRKLRFQIAGAH
jgi:dolichol-phosphate mannosyltransferase